VGYLKGKNKANLINLKKMSEMQLEIQELKYNIINLNKELKDKENELEKLRKKYEPSFAQKVLKKIKGDSEEE
jgi:predicted  nucleic acid-binding Zn-ribbon protein